VSKDAYAYIDVHRVGDGLVPEGFFTVTLDGSVVATPPVGPDGTATVLVAPHNTLALGNHDISVAYTGNGSFHDSLSGDVPFGVVGDLNISVGDVSIVNATSGTQTRNVIFPIVLSKASATAITVHYTTQDQTAIAGTDYVALSGNLTIKSGTEKFVIVKVLPNPTLTTPRTFSLVISAPPTGIGGGYVLRRPIGTGTILHDASNAPETVNIGDASVPEGDYGRRNAMKLPITLSGPAPSVVRVLVTVSSQTAVHKSKTDPGDWVGGVHAAVAFQPGVVTQAIAVNARPDLTDERDETVQVNIDAVCTSGTTLATCVHASSIVISDGSAIGTILSDE
jgi:hypothetical protein